MKIARLIVIASFFIPLLLFMLISLMLVSIGGYQGLAMSNIYLYDLGVGSGTIDGFKSLLAYLALMRIIVLISGLDLVRTAQIAGAYSVLLIVFSYLIFFYIIFNKSSSHAKYSAYIYSLFFLSLNPHPGYVLGFSLPLVFIILVLIIKTTFYKVTKPKLYAIILLLWITLGFMWHTAQVMLYIMIISYFVILQVVSIAEKNQTVLHGYP